MDPDCWRTALDISDGDARRIRVLSAFEVVVENQPRGAQGKELP